MHLRCSEPGCDLRLDLHDRALECQRCGGLLEIAVDAARMDRPALKETWRRRRSSDDPRDLSGVWRFREFLPNDYPADSVVTMKEGNVPLLAAGKSAHWAGVRNLWFKHLGWNPTGCFKDLGMTVGITEARFQRASVVACASTGNTAGSMAAYAARAGMRARVYLPKGAVSLAKLAQSLDHGAEVVEIEGNFDRALEMLLQARSSDLYFLNSINPFRIEGQKTVMFELMEQMAWKPPDYVFVPGGNLGNSSAFGKGLEEMKAAGIIDKVPRLVVVQAAGANPFVRCWRGGGNSLEPMEHPRTAATAIRIGAPRSWKKAVRSLRFTCGTATDVSDDEIAEAKAIIGCDGIGCEPASATTLAGLRKLVAEGEIDKDATVVAILTGHLLKDTEYVIRSWREAGERAQVEAESRCVR